MIDGTTNSFGKTICSICYEDLKPIVEDLQSISVCGHVFHELCLQQWFEYCSSTKKCTCPVCKQGCKVKDVSRLYFQSIGGDFADPIPRREEDPDALRRELRRLEGKVLGLDSLVEQQEKEIREVNKELCRCKELREKETASKNEALKEKTFLQQMLRVKTEELDKSNLECLKSQERSMALAKELASLKLVSDLDLDEEEMLKFAAFGNGTNHQNTIDVLRRSLALRNKSYKELMTKCNILGRGESRSTKKLDKAKEKISKLKERVKELQISVEVQANEILRELKASKKTRFGDDIMFNVNASKDKSRHSFGMEDEPLPPRKAQNNLPSDGNVSKSIPIPESKSQPTEDEVILQSAPKIPITSFGINKEAFAYPSSDEKPLSSEPNSDRKTAKSFVIDLDDDVTMISDEDKQVKATLNIRKESPNPQALPNPGGSCFSGGLRGPDGTNRYLGKWCKRAQNNETSGNSTQELISIGADGRGGRVKVLRSLNQSSLDSKENSVGTKRFKNGGKTFRQPSRGCLQMEHFFGKVSN